MAVDRIVVGVDGSPAAENALRWSTDLALSFDAEIVAVYVVPQSWLITLNAFQVKTKTVVAGLRAKLVGEWTDTLRERGVRYTTDCVRGDPSTALLEIADARHADVIVIGGSHHGTLRRALLGGTAHHIVNRSALPVLVVPMFSEDVDVGYGPIPG